MLQRSVGHLYATNFAKKLQKLWQSDICNKSLAQFAQFALDPIIILTNNNIFPKDYTFTCRMFTYVWRPFNDLRYVKKKLNPHAYIELLKRFNIINDKGEHIFETIQKYSLCVMFR